MRLNAGRQRHLISDAGQKMPDAVSQKIIYIRLGIWYFIIPLMMGRHDTSSIGVQSKMNSAFSPFSPSCLTA
jgi:hypothetical protein